MGAGDPAGDELTQTHYFLSSIRTLRRASELLLAVPQRRKTVVFISVGIPYQQEASAAVVLAAPGEAARAAVAKRDLRVAIKNEMHDMFRRAQQSNVNVYCVDPGGLDGLAGYLMARGIGPVAAMTRAGPFRDFLRAVASNTGGHAFVDTNEFDTGVAQIFRENSSYYLLGYRSTNLQRNGGFRRVEVKVNRPDVEVRARSGYYGPGETESRAGASVAALDKALASLLPSGDLPMQVSAIPFATSDSIESSVAIVLGLRQPPPTGAVRVTEQVNLAIHAYGPEGQPRGSHRLKAELQLRPVPGGEVQYEVLSQIDLRPGRDMSPRLGAERRHPRSPALRDPDDRLQDGRSDMERPLSRSEMLRGLARSARTRAPGLLPDPGARVLTPVI
jgi:hypothetical protein